MTSKWSHKRVRKAERVLSGSGLFSVAREKCGGDSNRDLSAVNSDVLLSFGSEATAIPEVDGTLAGALVVPY